MRALITGITGFAGSHLAELLLSMDIEAFGIKRVRSCVKNIEAIKKDVALFDCDLADPNGIRAIIEDVRPDHIYHLAAQSFVKASWDDPVYTTRNNIEGQLNLLNAVRDAKLGPQCAIIVAGSSEEYGDVAPENIPIHEGVPLLPLSPYAVSKVAQDLMGFQYVKSYGLNITRSRAFNHTGPRRGDVFATSSFAKQIAEIEAGKREPVIRHGNLDAVRDFTDVRDTVKAYFALAQKALIAGRPSHAPLGGVFNICTGVGVTIESVLNTLIGLSDCQVEKKIDENRLRPSDLPILIGDNSSIRRATDWEPTIPLDQTLADLLDYWRASI